jgi:hypothetical protein
MKRVLRILAVVVAMNVAGGIAVRTHNPGVCYAHSASIPPDPNDGGYCTCGWFWCGIGWC